MTKYAVKLSDEKEKRAEREREASFIGDRQSHCPVSSFSRLWDLHNTGI